MTFTKLAKFSVILSILPALYYAFFPGKIALITVLCAYPLIIGAILSLKKQTNKNIDRALYIKIFIVYNIIVLIRGLMDANSSQDWIVLFSSSIPLILFIHFSIYLGICKASLIILIRTFLTYGLLLCVLLLFITDDPGPLGFAHVISPIYLLILIVPYLGKKFKILILTIALFSFFSDITIRSNLLNITVAFCIAFTFLWRKKKGMLKAVKGLRGVLLILPVLFLVLGVTGVYNVFRIGESFGEIMVQNSRGDTDDILVDSRTEIYMDVFSQLKREEAILFGLGASGKTKTFLTDYEDFDIVYKEGRRGTESGMLNYIQWGGIVGGVIYFLLFVNASYYGIYKSRNWFCVMLGLWVAYKGFFSFIEDPMSFTTGSMFVLVPIGICLSKEFRSMSDQELKFMFRNIFKKKVGQRPIITKSRTF